MVRLLYDSALKVLDCFDCLPVEHGAFHARSKDVGWDGVVLGKLRVTMPWRSLPHSCCSLAVNSGGRLWGRGFGRGSQLPERWAVLDGCLQSRILL